MNKKAIKWLYSELPELVKKSIITADTAKNIKKYYGEVSVKNKRDVALIIFGIIGALLIGLGIILLLAHNWEELSRPVRTILSILPLIIGQSLAAWTINSKSDSTAWREGTATFLTISIGASIALVAQTYNISGNPPRFFLTWMLLAIPLAYFLQSCVPALLYLIAIPVWTATYRYLGGNQHLFWLLLILFVPYYWQLLKKNRYSVSSTLLSWGITICIPIAIGISLKSWSTELWIIIYCSIVAISYQVGELWFAEAVSGWKHPYRRMGWMGSFLLSLLLSFDEVWDSIYSSNQLTEYFPEAILAALTAVVSLILFGVLLTRKKSKLFTMFFGMLPILATSGWVIARYMENPVIPAIIFNIYLFSLSVVIITAGIKEMLLSVVNIGMFMLSALIVVRFFDSDMSILARGIAFIVIGVGFLTANFVIIKRKGLEAK